MPDVDVAYALAPLQAALADRYTIERELGRGGMATVYLARDARHARPVALKVLRPEVATALGPERFLREIQIAASLAHPHILPLHDSGAAAGFLYYVMPYVEGQSLRERLEREPQLPVEQAVQIARQVADALSYAHGHDVVHRDIKPDNILFAAGHAVVSDFGIARAITAAGDRLTETGVVIGTPAYMSPEQACGAESLDGRSDVYSLGCVLYEMLAGEPPYTGPNAQIVIAKQLADPVPSVRRLRAAVPAALDAVVATALAKTAADRFATAAQFAAALAAPEELRRVATAAAGSRTVGYEDERAALREGLQSAVAGRGLVVCVAGEPGSGKTTLVEDFLAELVASGRPCHIARGRCSERLAGTGAYLPLLDALEGLLSTDPRGAVAHLMKQLAPNWYTQVAPPDDASKAGAAPGTQAASQERLKREFNAFCRDACHLRPLVFFLDDVHWVDASTIDVLGHVANQMGTAQMLIVATYRPSELALAKHPFGPLKLDLQSRGLCREVSLDLLTRDDIEQFLALEFPNHRFPPSFAAFVHAKTEGSPLFMVDLLRYLRGKNIVVAANGGWKLAGAVPDLERELPESVRSMIERKIEQLGEDDRKLLVVAGVQGYECDSAIVAQVLGADVADVEERLDTLGRVHGFVRPLREYQLPDATPAVRYRFVHVLYQNAFYGRLAPTRRAALSRAVAEALLAHYRERSAEVAAELAFLFEAAREVARAVEYFALAAERAAAVFAHREAVALAERALTLLRTLPDTPQRAGQELGLQLRLGYSLMFTKGYTHPESGAAMARAREICQSFGDTAQLFPAVFGVWAFYVVSGEMRAARETAEQLLRMAESAQDPILLHGAHTAMGCTLEQMAELAASHQHFEQAISLHDLRQHDAYLVLYRQDLGLFMRSESARVLWLLGFPERALRRLEDAFALARQIADPIDVKWPLVFAPILHQHRGEPERSLECAEQCLAHAEEHGLEAHVRWGRLLRGWAVAELGDVEAGIAQMQESLAAHRAIRQLIIFPYELGLLAATLAKAVRIDEGLAAVREALEVVAATEQRFYEAELYRQRGELLLRGAGTPPEAETAFREALAIARGQQAKSLELRAAMSLARLWGDQGKRGEARDLLAPVYGWFTEGFDTRDLRDAKALLEELSA